MTGIDKGAVIELSNVEGIPLNARYTQNTSLKRTGAIGKFSACANPSITLSFKAKYERCCESPIPDQTRT
ncbi:hypothetical protein [Acidithrix sp. C25]|uniref:hypothetical protein n=1 Tax=Acidithrix sp. C25 TaxID=1671482 RepID=UPI00191B96A2|nr:hypothetical protein [Acidithrix sp. C25]